MFDKNKPREAKAHFEKALELVFENPDSDPDIGGRLLKIAYKILRKISFGEKNYKEFEKYLKAIGTSITCFLLLKEN